MSRNPDSHIPLAYIKKAMQMAGLGLWQISIDETGEIGIQVNENLRSMIGLDEESFPRSLADYLAKCIHPDDRAAVERVTRTSLDNKTALYSVEHRILNHADNQWFWVEAKGDVGECWPDGRPRIIYGCTIDIHEQYMIRQRLSASEAALKVEQKRIDAIIEAAGLVVWDWDLVRDQVCYGGRTSQEGLRDEKLRGPRERFWQKALSEPDQQLVLAAQKRHLEGETEFYESEIQLRQPDGSTIWARDRGRVVDWDEKGQPSRMMGVTMDVTHHRAVSEALAESRLKMEQIVEGADMATWDWDLPTDTLAVNKIYCRILGLECGEFPTSMWKWVDEVLHPEDREKTRQSIDGLIRGDFDSKAMEMRTLHRNGQYIWLYGVGRVLERDARGRAVRMAGIQFDYTEKSAWRICRPIP